MSLDIKGFLGLGADINKQDGEMSSENREGIVSDKLPDVEVMMSDADLIKIANKWESAWQGSSKRNDWLKQIEENEDYWLGKQFDTPKIDKRRPQVDNIIFEALETFLPQTTRRNPEPLIEIDSRENAQNPAYEQLKEKVKNRLTDLADENKLRLKLKKAVRHWAIYQIGIGKFGWDLDKDMPILRIIRAKRIILDPDATIDEDGYTGDRIGEYRKLTAGKIKNIISNNDGGTEEGSRKIQELIDKENDATEINFTEWWTPEMLFWKLGGTILLKTKNPHWNYDNEITDTVVDDLGNETESTQTINGINHFPVPRMPYIFLSVFNLGDQPMDKTGLMQQNLSNQDLINKRIKQIDYNADKMNGGAVISLQKSGLSQAQAKNVSRAIRDGGSVLIPSGDARDAVYFPQIPSLPADIYNQLVDTRGRLRDIFGTSGSTPAGVKEENTVRGKIQIRSLDTDRIGGGVSEYLEQFADDIYNWLVQLLYVYDPEFQFIDGAKPPRLIISVKEGSLLPKDSISIANQALELAGMNRISNIDLYKRLEYPNPDELAANVWLEQNAPQLLYKENPLVQEALQLQAQAKAQERQEEMRDTVIKESVKSRAKETPNRQNEEILPNLPVSPNI